MPNLVTGVKESFTSGLVPAQLSTSGNQKTFFETLNNKDLKQVLNYGVNGTSTLLSFFTFANSNFHFYDSIQETLETCSQMLTKIAYSSISIIGAIDLQEKKNFLPFLGYIISIPLPFFIDNDNLWLAGGIPNGLSNFILISDQREVVNGNGDPIPDKDGNVQLINGDFGERGWWYGFSKTLTECFKMTKEIIQKPERIKKISHTIFISTIFEILGPITAFIGLEKTGSLFRTVGTTTTQLAMLLHKNSSDKNLIKNQEKINLKSPIAQSGILWIGAALTDFLKRSNFISENISDITHLSLGLDRAASTLFNAGIINIKYKKC